MEVWMIVLGRWGMRSWVKNLGDYLVDWLLDRVADRGFTLTAIILIWWCLWRHRNDVTFEGAHPSSQRRWLEPLHARPNMMCGQ